MDKLPFIGIAGLIGVGKSTLSQSMAFALDLPHFAEPVDDNIYLADFYSDPQKWGFEMQVYLLNRRFQQHQEIIWGYTGGVQDRTIYEDQIFAKSLSDQGLMDERSFQTYRSLFDHMSNFMRLPNAIVYLEASPETCLERIKRRARGVETGITLSYLQHLDARYKELMDELDLMTNVITIDWEEFGRTDDVIAEIEPYL